MEKPKLIKLTIKDMGAPIWINPATIESIQPLGNIHQGGIYSKIQFSGTSNWTTVLETPEQVLEAISGVESPIPAEKRQSARTQSEQGGEWPDMFDKFYEGLGWMHAECCAALDRGEDPRTFEIGAMVKRCIHELARPHPAEQQSAVQDGNYVSIGWVESAYSGDPDTRGMRTIKTVDPAKLNKLPIGTKVYVLDKDLQC